MKLSTFLAAPFLAAVMLSSPTFAAPSDESVIRQAEQSWILATSNTDRDALNALLDDSYREITPAGTARSKSDVLNAPPPPAGSSQTLKDVQVRVDGDQAQVTGENHFTTANGQTTVYLFKDEFARKDGSWRVIASQAIRK
ncbi:nuclear transport factor 2 family protein [Paraburkholderia sp. SIMBA_055]